MKGLMKNVLHSELPEFQRTQLAFAAHIRNPEQYPAPNGLEDRRLAIYRDLFYNNVEGFISASFPVLRSIMADDAWHHLVRRFFADHSCKSPYFLDIAEEFLDWLADEYIPNKADHDPAEPTFIQELAHYEWVELKLSIMDERPDQSTDHNGDLISQAPVISPLAWHLAYQYPVHQISQDYLPDSPGEEPTYLIVYRDRLHEVHFLEVNAVTYRLLALIQDNPSWHGRALLDQIIKELQHQDPDMVRQHGMALLQDLRQRNIITGTKATTHDVSL